MKTATHDHRFTARAAAALGLFALVIGSFTAPSATAAELLAGDAALIQITQEGESLVVGAGAKNGTPVTPDDVIAVDGVSPFSASIDTSTISAEAGPLTIRIEATLPDGVAPQPSDSDAPQLRISSADDSVVLLGTATDAPHETELDAGALRATLWSFTAPGEYRITFTATGPDGASGADEPSTLVFQVAGGQGPAPSPDAAPSPDPTPTPSPDPTPSPSATPGTGGPGEDASLPKGQSDQPAPPSQEKLVLDNGHMDVFNLTPDGRGISLTFKEDVTGAHVKHRPESVQAFVKPDAHLAEGAIPDAAKNRFPTEIRNGDFHYLPLTQDHNLIWPGWDSLELGAAYGDPSDIDINITAVDGPGDVFLWSNDSFGGIKPLLNKGYQLPGTIHQNVLAHTHANWAFTEPGTYILTANATAAKKDGSGVVKSTEHSYSFVVAEATHTQTRLSADTTELDPGDPVIFTAKVSPGGVGAVQFRDEESGSILGHTPVTKGTAVFQADALTPGRHRIVAEFVPTWKEDFTASQSTSVMVDVTGEQKPKPTEDDTEPVSNADISAQKPATTVTVTNTEKIVVPLGNLAATVDRNYYGEWVSVWVHGAEPVWLGWTQADLRGAFSVGLPSSVSEGTHRLVIKNTEGALIGWDGFTVKALRNDTGTPGGGGGNGGGGGGGSAKPKPTAPGQQCVPGIVLDHGHIDAFYVSAANGKAVLQLMEDVTGYHVIREAESVLLRVKESAYRGNIPAPGGPRGYVLPLTQDNNLIWPGWDTNRTSASGYTDVAINVTGVGGPAQVYMYTQGSFGDWKPILTHGGYAFPGTIREPAPAHTHAQWVFPEKGIYKLTAHAVATNPKTGASIRTASHTYVFQVGDVPLGDTFCGLRSADASAALGVNQAVNAAAQEAVAAAQADAAAKAKADDEKSEAQERKQSRTNDSQEQDDGLLASIFGENVHPGVIAGVLGGGALVVGGIIGGTVWYVRRLGASAVDAGTGSGGST